MCNTGIFREGLEVGKAGFVLAGRRKAVSRKAGSRKAGSRKAGRVGLEVGSQSQVCQIFCDPPFIFL